MNILFNTLFFFLEHVILFVILWLGLLVGVILLAKSIWNDYRQNHWSDR